MKKIILFFTIAILFSACSAQYRLNQLLRRHPELKTATISHEIQDTIQLPHVRVEQPIALADLQYLALATPLPLTEEIATTHNPSIPIEAGCAALSITPHPTSRDSLLFILQQLPEVIVLCDTIQVPEVIYTEAQASLSTWQRFFYHSGIIIWLIIFFLVTFKAANYYYDHR